MHMHMCVYELCPHPIAESTGARMSTVTRGSCPTRANGAQLLCRPRLSVVVEAHGMPMSSAVVDHCYITGSRISIECSVDCKLIIVLAETSRAKRIFEDLSIDSSLRQHPVNLVNL